MSEDKLRKDILKASQAHSILSNEAFTNGIEQIRQGLVTKWMASSDTADRDRCWMAVNLLEKVEGALTIAVMNGKLAQAEIDAIVAGEKAA